MRLGWVLVQTKRLVGHQLPGHGESGGEESEAANSLARP